MLREKVNGRLVRENGKFVFRKCKRGVSVYLPEGNFCGPHGKKVAYIADIRARIRAKEALPVKEKPPTGILERQRIFAIDSQNVHDGSITKIVNEELKDLGPKKCFNQKDKNEFKDLVVSELERILKKPAIVRSATRIVKYVEGENFIYLLSVWNRLESDDEKEVLFHQLSDCITSAGDIVCPTGVRNRILYSLWICKKIDSVDKTSIREEMMSKAAKLRDEYEKSFKQRLISTFRYDYVDKTKIMTRAELDEELSEWIDSI